MEFIINLCACVYRMEQNIPKDFLMRTGCFASE